MSNQHDFGSAFDGAVSPEAVRKAEAQIQQSVDERRIVFGPLQCVQMFLLPAILLCLIWTFGWCTFIPFPTNVCIDDDDTPPLRIATWIRRGRDALWDAGVYASNVAWFPLCVAIKDSKTVPVHCTRHAPWHATPVADAWTELNEHIRFTVSTVQDAISTVWEDLLLVHSWWLGHARITNPYAVLTTLVLGTVLVVFVIGMLYTLLLACVLGFVPLIERVRQNGEKEKAE